MNTAGSPRVSIGVPVFNGENYLAAALDSLLNQTYRDFELIIADNASTDRTAEICAGFASADSRVSYLRNEVNIGVDENFNRVFRVSRGEYFKWAAHDDLCAPTFLERCIEVLDRDSSVVLCHPRAMIIDEHGSVAGRFEIQVDATSSKAHERFYNLIHVDHWCFEIYGLIRANALRRTMLHGLYSGSDRVLLAELGLLGRFHELPEFLFFRRDHPLTSMRVSQGHAKRLTAYSPADGSRASRFLGLRRFQGYASAVRRSGLPKDERRRCYQKLVRLALEKGAGRAENRARRIAARIGRRAGASA
ncbi:MAG: glycosyltransferase family 2 protein [Bryobacterales bacterium]|nr:glycosyltransferase family 2 protein [Bryobacterales bacterium]